MNSSRNLILILFIIFLSTSLRAQQVSNCFLEDFELKYASIPPFENAEKPIAQPSVTITINASDTIGKISKYIFGNALAAWIGNDPIKDPVFINNVQKLSPTLIRYPGGSWADIFFWNGKAENIPPTVWDGTQNKWINFTPQFGMNSWPTTVDNYYYLRELLGVEGLITINYGYARYGTGKDPVAEAAHLAAEWVRYDDGRTKFWEIGNENGGPWEAGWKIDSTLNQDNQPEIITGELYGKHFKIIADSMRKAAAERDNKIFIGGQILHYDGTNSWNVADRKWNEGFFKEVGDAADFYVIHNYIGRRADAKDLLDVATQIPKQMMDFIKQDIANKNAPSKPIAITEWNMDQSGSDLGKTSIINGMQAVILFNEFIRLNYGMTCRWLLANWENDGMFYRGNNSQIPKWNPRPDFYYIYYLQKFTGDHSIRTSVTGAKDIIAYATTFSSGHIGAVIINKSKTEYVLNILPTNYGFGEKYFIYTLTGGTDKPDFSQYVFVNGYGPSDAAWGPLDDLEDIPAFAYNSNGEIKFTTPARSVQFILIEPGNYVSVKEKSFDKKTDFKLYQNYPNPFNPQTIISYSIPFETTISLKIYDVMGRNVATLINNEKKTAGSYDILFDAKFLSSGIYFCRLTAENFTRTIKMVLIR